MGRIKTKVLKRAAFQLMNQNKGVFTDDFAKNKELLKNYVSIPSQKLRNIIAGSLTKLSKRAKSEK